MNNIRTKEIKPKTIKTIDKAVTWTERIKDPISNLNSKVKNSVDENQSIGDYGEREIKYLSNRVSNEVVYENKKLMHKGKNKVIEKMKKHKGKNIKTAMDPRKNVKKSQESAKFSKLMFERSKKFAINSAKNVASNTKNAIKGTISAIKGIMTALKSLIGLLIAGGFVSLIIIIVICLIGLLFASIFGIFFSSLKIDIGIQPKTMSECIVDLNDEMNKKISNMENNILHDEVVIDSNRANWSDIIAIYSVKVNGGNNQEDVMTLDIKKQGILSEVFWDMNEITFDTRWEKYQPTSIGTLDRSDFALSNPNNRNAAFDNDVTTNQDEEKDKLVLYIKITGKSLDDMKTEYALNDSQLKQLDEITGDDKVSMWNSVIYGDYGDKGDYTKWRKTNSEWAYIKIGSTRAMLGDIGCLATSVSILIAKSGIDTPNIEPFNPGTFVTALNYNYGFDAGGNLQYGPISKVVPGFEYVGRINLRNKPKGQKLSEIRDYYNQGYYLAVEVLGAKYNSQHWVAVDNVTDTTVLMIDPDTDATDMWEQYDWNNTTQFIYFKANKEG